MFKNLVIATSMFWTLLTSECFPQQGSLFMGMDDVRWEANTGTAPLLYKNVDAADLVEVRAKVKAQTQGNWSVAGVIVRQPGPLSATENFTYSGSFSPESANAGNPPLHLADMSTDGVETELTDDAPADLDDLRYLRLMNLGGGEFEYYRGADDGMGGINWTAHSDGTLTNPNLATGPLEVGIGAWAHESTSGFTTEWDWVEIETTSTTYSDSFVYNRDLAAEGVAPGPGTTGLEIWDGIHNASAGGIPTHAVIPEPSAQAILVLALTALGLVRRRHRVRRFASDKPRNWNHPSPFWRLRHESP